MWNEFLPISMPTTAIAVCAVASMACSFVLAPLASLSLAGQGHGRTIPLAEVGGSSASPARLRKIVISTIGRVVHNLDRKGRRAHFARDMTKLPPARAETTEAFLIKSGPELAG